MTAEHQEQLAEIVLNTRGWGHRAAMDAIQPVVQAIIWGEMQAYHQALCEQNATLRQYVVTDTRRQTETPRLRLVKEAA